MKKLLYILSHRSVFVALSLVAQIGALFFLLSFFSESDAAFYWSCIALSIVSSLLILGSRLSISTATTLSQRSASSRVSTPTPVPISSAHTPFLQPPSSAIFGHTAGFIRKF